MRDIQVNCIVVLEILIDLLCHVGTCTEYCTVWGFSSVLNVLLTISVCCSQINFAIRSLTLFWTPILNKIPMLKLRAVRFLTQGFACCLWSIGVVAISLNWKLSQSV